MRKLNLFAACAAAAMLSACGGGATSGGGLNITPLPPPPPPPPPPPSFPLSSSASFETVSGRAAYQISNGQFGNGNGTVLSGTIAADPRGTTVTVGYDSATGTYTIQDPIGSAAFTAADRTGSTGFEDTYVKTSGTATDQLRLYGNVRSGGPQAGAPLQLTYLSYGIWSHRDSASTARRLTYALFGFPTTSANMPKTGSASYQTYVLAHQIAVGATFGGDDDLTGTASFDVDFGTGGIKTDLNLGSAGLYNGTGLVTGDRFSGNFTSSIQYFTGGTFNGGFFGPTAQEMGYAFELRRHNPDPFAGAAPQPSDYLITGAVLGTKK